MNIQTVQHAIRTMVLCSGYVDILCGSLLACGRVLPAAAALQFHPKCSTDGPAHLLLRLLVTTKSALRIPPVDLQTVECFYGAHTLEALLCALQAQAVDTCVQQVVEDIIAEAPQRSAVAGHLRRRDELMNDVARVEHAWNVDPASEWQQGCLLRLQKVLLRTCDSQCS
jgi:hypothetical protein